MVLDYSLLTAPKRTSLAKDITNQLRQLILRGVFLPGSPLSEASLARQLKVSRAPVREAMIVLEREGLLQSDERGRSKVREITAKDFNELCSLRELLESMAAKLACHNWSAEATALVEANLRLQREAQTLEDLCRLDADLHEQIVSLSGHGSLLYVWQLMRPQFEMCLAHTNELQVMLSEEPRNNAVNAHRELLAALASGDEARAVTAISAHIDLWRSWDKSIGS
jgi:DNA-binding GntR family transcriptional regulator